MNPNDYDSINFDAFTAEQYQVLTSEETDSLKQNFYKSIGVERGLKRRARKARSKLVIVVAAIVMVLALGAVAYATDLFGLRILQHQGRVKEETAYPEGSAQFKALEEYTNYEEQLSDEDYQKYVFTEDGSLNPKNKKLKKILDKYNLVFPDKTKITYANSAERMFEKEGIPNFLGSAKGYKNNKNLYEGTFLNYNIGKITVSMMLKDDLYHDQKNKLLFYPERYRQDELYVQCVKKNVFPYEVSSPPGWSSGDDDQTHVKWNYTTKEGIDIKCVGSIVHSTLGYTKLDGSDAEIPIYYCDYSVITAFDNYSVLVNYTTTIDRSTKEVSKEKFETVIDDFEFSKLM